MKNVEQVEQQVIEMLLEGDHPVLEVLREQFKACSVWDREYTGVGFYTGLSVPETVKRVHCPTDFAIDDVCIELEREDSARCGFVLFVREGALACLECFLWRDGYLPKDAVARRYYYIRTTDSSSVEETTERDWERLDAKLNPETWWRKWRIRILR
ncbi:MAG: hypothetical protein IPM63_05070 [Acidobacteriota bacterium]|nr:MAG: hypothetical protein IPM63_05070 [Acidobacteriota bacterium]